MFRKDAHKERRFEALSKPNLQQMPKIEQESWSEMFKTIKQSVASDTSLIVEGNFHRSQRRKIQSLIQANVVVVEIFCYAKGCTILKRYIHRNKSGERHKGHRDHLLYPLIAFEGLVLGFKHYRPLQLSHNVLKVDTNDFAAVDYAAIRRFIRSAQ
jgi:hypothetical protein